MDDKKKREDEKKKLEIEVSQMLTQGEMESEDPEKAAVDNLPHRYEVRIQTPQDPIVKETELYRKMAKEVDGRYDKYQKKK